MTPVVEVRCRVCYEHVPAVKVGLAVAQVKVHLESDSDARCTGSLSVVPIDPQA